MDVGGKMLFKTVALRATRPCHDKDSLATFKAKVEEHGKSALISRILHCDEAESGSPGLTWLEIIPKVANVCGDAGPLTPVRVIVSPTLLQNASDVASGTDCAYSLCPEL